MTGNEQIVLDHIISQVGKDGKWAVSLDALAGATGLSKDDTTTALKGLEDARYIDQFPLSQSPMTILGLRLVNKN